MNPATTKLLCAGRQQRTDLAERELEGGMGGSRAVDVLREGPAQTKASAKGAGVSLRHAGRLLHQDGRRQTPEHLYYSYTFNKRGRTSTCRTEAEY